MNVMTDHGNADETPLTRAMRATDEAFRDIQIAPDLRGKLKSGLAAYTNARNALQEDKARIEESIADLGRAIGAMEAALAALDGAAEPIGHICDEEVDPDCPMCRETLAYVGGEEGDAAGQGQ